MIAGEHQPAAVQAIAAAINAALGNIGQTLVGRKIENKPAASPAELARAITDKKIKTLFIVGGNPVYNAPADSDLEVHGEIRGKAGVRLGPAAISRIRRRTCTSSRSHDHDSYSSLHFFRRRLRARPAR